MTKRTNICYRCSRVIVYIINLIFWMTGAALLGLGIWLYVTNSELYKLTSLGNNIISLAALFITPACLCIIIGFLGFCGAVTENRCMITTNCVLVVIVFIIQLGMGLAALISGHDLQLKTHIEHQLEVSIKERYPSPGSILDDHSKYIVVGWNKLQEQFKCCGIRDYRVWFKSHGWPNQDRVPDSCCVNPSANCGLPSSTAQWNTQGCLELINEYVDSKLFCLAVITIVFAALQLSAVMGAILFLVYQRRKKLPR